MKIKTSLALVAIALLSGCAAAPKSAPEFRQSVASGVMGHDHMSYTANRSTREIGKTFQAQAGKCLTSQLERTATVNPRLGGAQSNTQFIYSPKVLNTNTHAELQVQMTITGDVIKLQDEPEGGYYVLLADAQPIDSKHSKIDVYYSTYRAQSIADAIKGWAEGDNLDCPDIAGTFK